MVAQALREVYTSVIKFAGEPGFEFAVFRKSNGKYLVAFSDGAFYDRKFGKEPGNGPTLFLLSYEGGRWRDVTSAVLPAGFDRKMAYKLPRHGRSMEVWGGRGRNYTLTWRGDRFSLDRKARK